MTVVISALLIACNSGEGGHSDHSSHSTNDTAAAAATPDTGMGAIMQRMEQQMMADSPTVSIDYDFAALMRPHHQAAVDMARLQLEKGRDAQLQELARSILADQEREIATLDSFLSNTPRPARAPQSHFEMGMEGMHGAHGGGSGHEGHGAGASGTVDRQFAELMIPHHQGAIDMARTYMERGGKDPALVSIARAITTSQQKEIEVLQAWLKNNGG